jgi:hypothetical protein
MGHFFSPALTQPRLPFCFPLWPASYWPKPFLVRIPWPWFAIPPGLVLLLTLHKLSNAYHPQFSTADRGSTFLPKVGINLCLQPKHRPNRYYFEIYIRNRYH